MLFFFGQTQKPTVNNIPGDNQSPTVPLPSASVPLPFRFRSASVPLPFRFHPLPSASVPLLFRFRSTSKLICSKAVRSYFLEMKLVSSASFVRKDTLYAVIEVLECKKGFTYTSVSSLWKMTARRLSVRLHDDLTVSWPLWWYQQNDTIVCLH